MSSSNSAVYRHPRYYALGYRWNTEVECDFIEACLKRYGPQPSAAAEARVGGTGQAARRLLDIGCGAGRHMTELATRGHQLTGVDLSPEMVAFVQAEARKSDLSMTAAVDDLRVLSIDGIYDAAFCFMDTFRFLLTNDEIIRHLRAVAERLAPGGLYLTDFWVPSQWEQIGSEIHQWEQTEGDTTVRVFYLQHPDSIDPVAQTFEDELVFEVQEDGQTKDIRGGPTRTRLLLPQEFKALAESSASFEFIESYGAFDLSSPLSRDSLSWRMISVLKRKQ